MPICKFQPVRATGTRAFAAEGAAPAGEINLGIAATAANQNLFRADAYTIATLIANLQEGAFRYCPGWTMGGRSGRSTTPQQLEFMASHSVFPLYILITTHCARTVQAGIDLNQGISSFQSIQGVKIRTKPAAVKPR